MWVKIDDAFHRHPKTRAAGKDGRALFIAGLCWSAAHLTDGHIARTDLPLIAAEAEVRPGPTARRLVEVGLWHVTPDGWEVHDYLDFNPSGDEVRERKRKRAEAGRKGGKRSGQARRQREATSEANASADAQHGLERERSQTEPRPRTPTPSGSTSPPTGTRAAPPEPGDDDAHPDPGSRLWADQLARQLPELDPHRARTELLTAHAEHPDWPDHELVASIAARAVA